MGTLDPEEEGDTGPMDSADAAPAWLSEVGDMEPEPLPEPVLETEPPIWADEVAPPAGEEEPLPPTPEGSIHETLEWLNEMGTLEEEPAEGLEPGETLPVTETDFGPEWLKDMGALQPEPGAEPEPDDEPPTDRRMPRFSFDRKPRWLPSQAAAPADDEPPEWLEDSENPPAWLRKAIEDDDLSEEI